jgi:IS605 OrfB family transposase
VRRRSIRERRRLRDETNRALNQLFANQRLARIVHEALCFSSFRLRRVTNRRLARWLWGFLLKRLRYKAELNGVELQVVSAAYTSQSCPRCWFTSSKNRRGERFLCIDCGYSGSADAVAATNVLRRGSDSAITGLVAPGAIRQILDARWRSARSGRAWGSNEQVSTEDVTLDPHLGQSREQPEDDVALVGPHGPALSHGPASPNESRRSEAELVRSDPLVV